MMSFHLTTSNQRWHSVMSGPYLLLSLPRSGSNFYSSLINSAPDTRIHIEPLSMHTGTALDDDLLECSQTSRKFKCRCQNCHVCCLRRWLYSGSSRGFKETTLFSILPAVQFWIPELKIIFINRPVNDIVRSHVNGNLYDTWSLARRPFVQQQFTDELLQKDKTFILSELQYRRLEYWNKFKHLFDVLEIEYEDILQLDTAQCCFTKISQFLNLSSSTPLMRAWHQRRSISNANINSIYSTFGQRELRHV